MTTATAKVLQKAQALVNGDRNKTHGDIWENHENIARLWNGYLEDKDGAILAEDVANMMELLKIARRKLGSLNIDDYIDGAGYAAVALECREFEREHTGRRIEPETAEDLKNYITFLRDPKTGRFKRPVRSIEPETADIKNHITFLRDPKTGRFKKRQEL
jgi:hypothetical protein